MIEQLRKKLIVKYTLLFACILFACYGVSYVTYRYNSLNFIYSSIQDYLGEEVQEARDFIPTVKNIGKVHKINSSIDTLHNYAYWFVDDELIRAEEPKDDYVAKEIMHRLTSKKYIAGQPYHENIKHHKEEWYFIMVKEDFKYRNNQKGSVFVLANYTPVRQNNKNYIGIATISLILLILFAFFIGNIFAVHSLRHIENAYQKQKRFVSDAAHEFRTPLAILYSYAELLEYNPQKRKKVIADIKDELQQMSEMVDCLLSIARYDNSNVVMHKERFSINDIVGNIIETLSNLYPKEIFILNEKDKNIKITADKVMIRQLLGIMLDNAIKYTGDNKKIIITLTKKISSVQISVKDNGIGIKKEDLPHIFDRFWRAETSRHQKGLGLGLSLAETIVNLHKGAIGVHSEFGKGTEFIITLPL